MEQGRCLVDHELRQYALQGKIVSPERFSPHQFQPASFEPTLSSELYSLDTETGGLLRPRADMSLEAILADIPPRHKRRHDISNGFELQTGHTYLVRLQEAFTLLPGERVKFSPRSSVGRIFLRARTLADYNSCFDEVHPHKDQPLHLWLLLQPIAFNVVVKPDQSLIQARFFVGADARLSDTELRALSQHHPLLYQPPLNFQADPFFSEGLQIHLDLEGWTTKGYVGLRARKTPQAVELSEVDYYDPLDFYDPLRVRDHGETLAIEPNRCYLLCSQEIVSIPPTHSAELRGHTHTSFDGSIHFAGFFDPGFRARAVFEVRSHESQKMVLVHGMPMSRFEFYRNNAPEKPYGSKDLGSTFQGQTGPQVPKFFKKLDYASLSKG